jgi:hypothetical protein
VGVELVETAATVGVELLETAAIVELEHIAYNGIHYSAYLKSWHIFLIL